MGECERKPAQAHCSFQSFNVLSVVQVLYFYVRLGWAIYPHPSWWPGLLRTTLFLVSCLRVPDDSQKQMSSLKLRSPSNLPGVEVNLSLLSVLPWDCMVFVLLLWAVLHWRESYRGHWLVTPCDLNWFGILFCFLKSSHLHSLLLSLVDEDLLGGRENPIKILQRTAEKSHTKNLYVGHTAITRKEKTHFEFCGSEKSVPGRFLLRFVSLPQSWAIRRKLVLQFPDFFSL